MTRRWIAYIILATAAAQLPSKGSSQESKVDNVMAAILQDWASIHPGDSEARLEKMFTPDGGLSAPDERTYISLRCPYVKTDVKFRSVGSEHGNQTAYVVKSVSKLYVDYPHAD